MQNSNDRKEFLRIKVIGYTINIHDQNDTFIEALIEDYETDEHETLKDLRRIKLNISESLHSHIRKGRIIKIRIMDVQNKNLIAFCKVTPLSLHEDVKRKGENPMQTEISFTPPGSGAIQLLVRLVDDTVVSKDITPVTAPSQSPFILSPESKYEPRKAFRKSRIIIKNEHQLKVNIFMEPTFCSVCNNFLWGVVNQGYQCTKCNLSCHKKCYQYIIGNCRRSINNSSNMPINDSHDFDTRRRFKFSYCNHCGNLVIPFSVSDQCKNCNISVHQRCEENVTQPCKFDVDRIMERRFKEGNNNEYSTDYQAYQYYKTGNFENTYLQPVLNKGVNINDFEILSLLGEGAFGKVFKVAYKKNNSICAMKASKKLNIYNKEDFLTCIDTELKILKQTIEAKFLVQFYCSIHDFEYVFFFMEFMEGGELYNYIIEHKKENNRGFDAETVRFYAAQVYLGLQFLHSKSIIFRDLKPENVLIDGKGNAKISDFGLSKMNVDFDHNRATTICGSPLYISPDILTMEPYTCSSDYWSYGCFVYELFAGVTPFYTSNNTADLNNIIKSFKRENCAQLYINTPYIDSISRTFINALLDENPKTRLGNPNSPYGAILDHQFFSLLDWNSVQSKEAEAPIKPKASIGKSEKLSRIDKIADRKLLNILPDGSFDDFYFVHVDYWNY